MNKWYVDSEGTVTELSDQRHEVESHTDWEEVHLLGELDPDGSAEVIDSYELHSRLVAEVFRERGIPQGV